MARIIYAEKIMTKSKDAFSPADLHAVFHKAIIYQQKLAKNEKRTAFCFIDPLLFAFESGNQFYCGCLQIPVINKLNYYRSGAGPIQALADACELVDRQLYDAVFIFGYDPLLANKAKYGEKATPKAVEIFDGPGLLACYNELGHLLCQLLAISSRDFIELADLLFQNYSRTYSQINGGAPIPTPVAKKLDEYGGDLFRLVDCANPNVNFAGGIIVGSTSTAELLEISPQEQVEPIAVKQAQVECNPYKLSAIAGDGANIFPHLRSLFQQLKNETGLDLLQELKAGHLLLDAYTCYPPIPLAFLLAGGFVNRPNDIPAFLSDFAITVTGGMNLAGAPWNNPALNSIIEMYRLLIERRAPYGLVHGNGGIGEAQGLALLQNCNL